MSVGVAELTRSVCDDATGCTPFLLGDLILVIGQHATDPRCVRDPSTEYLLLLPLFGWFHRQFRGFEPSENVPRIDEYRTRVRITRREEKRRQVRCFC